MTGLSAFQRSVAELFFSLPASEGFLLAGGGALLASGLTSRATEDLDFFGARERCNVDSARAQLVEAATAKGWSVDEIQASDTFARLHIRGAGEVVVDIALDVGAGHPSVITVAGPTFDPTELAGRKLIALFDRAEARDFADVYVLAQRFGRALLLDRAAEVDTGLALDVLAAMMRSISRFDDDDLPIGDAAASAVRAYFNEWAAELDGRP